MSNQKLDHDYWNERYKDQNTPWDIGYPSPALIQYLGQHMKPGVKILIPGAGNAYEANWLIRNWCDFELTILDISKNLTSKLSEKYASHPHVNVICMDFFQHEGAYDMILEQTFFCALNPTLRSDYMLKMNHLLKSEGRLAGLLFNVEFIGDGPPFGGNVNHYIELFNAYFNEYMVNMNPDSIPQRKGNEIFFELSDKKE